MSDQPSKEMVEAAARRLAYDYWPCATRDERNAWAEKYWPEHITKAEHAIIAALAARSHAPADRAEIVESVKNFMDAMSMSGLHSGTVINERLLAMVRASLVSFIEARSLASEARQVTPHHSTD